MLAVSAPFSGPDRKCVRAIEEAARTPTDGVAVGEQLSTRWSRRWRLGLASGCVTALCLATLPGASADGGDHDKIPSREQVRQAQQRADTTADRVAAIKAQLAAADQRLEQLTVAAGKAAEAYNGAR